MDCAAQCSDVPDPAFSRTRSAQQAHFDNGPAKPTALPPPAHRSIETPAGPARPPQAQCTGQSSSAGKISTIAQQVQPNQQHQRPHRRRHPCASNKRATRAQQPMQQPMRKQLKRRRECRDEESDGNRLPPSEAGRERPRIPQPPQNPKERERAIRAGGPPLPSA